MAFSPDGRWLIYASQQGGINDEEPLVQSVVRRESYGEMVRHAHRGRHDRAPDAQQVGRRGAVLGSGTAVAAIPRAEERVDSSLSRCAMRAAFAILMIVSLAVVKVSRAQAPASDDIKSGRQAVERALPLLQQSARTWTAKGGCFSCHHQGLGATAVALARERASASTRRCSPRRSPPIRVQLPDLKRTSCFNFPTPTILPIATLSPP